MLENINPVDMAIQFGGYISAVFTYIVGRRQARVNTDSTEIENLKQIIKLQQEQIDWQANRIKELTEQITELRNEIKELRGFE